jgi:hypothetical protein
LSAPKEECAGGVGGTSGLFAPGTAAEADAEERPASDAVAAPAPTNLAKVRLSII